MRNRSTGFAVPAVPQTSFSNVRDITRGQPMSQSRLSDLDLLMSARGTRAESEVERAGAAKAAAERAAAAKAKAAEAKKKMEEAKAAFAKAKAAQSPEFVPDFDPELES